jgi:hypothetical protein
MIKDKEIVNIKKKENTYIINIESAYIVKAMKEEGKYTKEDIIEELSLSKYNTPIEDLLRVLDRYRFFMEKRNAGMNKLEKMVI